jgi:hypothetical protein
LEIGIKSVKAVGKNINVKFVLKIVEIFYSNIAYSNIVYQLVIVCSNEIIFDIFRGYQQVATSCKVISVREGDRIQFNISSISL